MFFKIKHRKYFSSRANENNFSFCLAPFNAMHFSFNGKVYPCHNNNSLAYGQIGKNSIHEIWDSVDRKYYQNCLQKNQLKKTGCLQCLFDIEKRNYKSLNSYRYDSIPTKKDEKYPTILGFRFSDKCNIQCIMCFSNHNVRNISSNSAEIYDEAFFKDLRTFIIHAKQAYFLGGEPFFEELNFKVFDLFAELNPNCQITIQTNGMILNERIRGYLAKGNYSINVSLDSLSSETFEQIRKGAKFSKVKENIDEFRKLCNARKTNFSTCITPMRLNYKEIPSIIEYFNLHNNNIWINKYYFPAMYSIWALDSKKIKEIIDELTQKKIALHNEISNYNYIQFTNFIDVLKTYYKDAQIRENSKLDFQRESVKLLNIVRGELTNFGNFTKNNQEKTFELLAQLNDVNSKKLYYYLKLLLETYSGDKLAENLSLMNSEFIKQDIEYISI
ncbi:MAG: radical SAM protein [Bacteroidales bacterium]|nr:radical SAM protein [Bacteroidales bacterium]